MIVTSPLEFTALGAVVQSNVYNHFTQVVGTPTNTSAPASCVPTPPIEGVSVDSTVQFIRANYDKLFRRLAD